METKRKVYILSFTILGLLIGFLVHALIEIYYIKLLLNDFTAYSFGLTWEELIQFHFVFATVMVIGCGLWGYLSGMYFWRQIYVLKRFRQNTK